MAAAAAASVPRAAPPELNYAQQVPLALPSSQSQRRFNPVNGQKFSPNNSNIILIDINSDNFLDASHSYFTCKIQNEAGGVDDATRQMLLAGPACFIQKLRILSGGVELESIDSYSRLYNILQQCQSDQSRTQNSIMHNSPETYRATMVAQQQFINSGTPSATVPLGVGNKNVGAMAQTLTGQQTETEPFPQPGPGQAGQGVAWSGRVVAAEHNPGGAPTRYTEGIPSTAIGPPTPGANVGGVDGSQSSYQVSFPLLSALLNANVFLPLALSNVGITLEITLNSNRNTAVSMDGFTTSNGGATVFLPTNYSLTDCAFEASLVDLDASFTNQLKAEMYDRGAVTIHGNMFRHFQTTFGGEDATPTLAIQARMKSIKGIFTVFRDQATGYPALDSANPSGTIPTHAASTVDGLLLDQTCAQVGIKSFQYSIGSVPVPANPVKCGSTGLAQFSNLYTQNGTGCSEAYCSLMKSWGKLGDVQHQCSLTRTSFSQTGTANCLPGSFKKTFIAAVDTTSFNSRALTENGTDTASRALPISLTLTRDRSSEARDQVTYGCGLAADGPTPKWYTTGPAAQITADTYVMGDVFFYFTGEGNIVPSY